MKQRIVSPEKCRGCRNCELACRLVHSGDSLSALYSPGTVQQARNRIEKDPQGKPFPALCRHCQEPACVAACMSGAMSRQEDGLVTWNPDICVDCFMCVMNCPYGMARAPIQKGGRVSKCDGCAGRETMACAAACPSGAISLSDCAQGPSPVYPEGPSEGGCHE